MATQKWVLCCLSLNALKRINNFLIFVYWYVNQFWCRFTSANHAFLKEIIIYHWYKYSRQTHTHSSLRMSFPGVFWNLLPLFSGSFLHQKASHNFLTAILNYCIYYLEFFRHDRLWGSAHNVYRSTQEFKKHISKEQFCKLKTISWSLYGWIELKNFPSFC